MTDEIEIHLISNELIEGLRRSRRDLEEIGAALKGTEPRRCESCRKVLLEEEKFFCSKDCEDRANWDLWDREHESPLAHHLEPMR